MIQVRQKATTKIQNILLNKELIQNDNEDKNDLENVKKTVEKYFEDMKKKVQT